MRHFFTGIDIGTYHVKVVIAQAPSQGDGLRIIGTGAASSRGMRHGYIVNTKDATASIREAIEKAAAMAQVQVKSARIAVGGVGLDELRASGEAQLTTSGGEVTERDVERAIAESERRVSAQLVNRKVVHAIALRYYVDNEPVLGRPLGLRGSKLSVDTLLITALEQHLQDLIEAVESAGIEVEDVMAAPLAASLVTLSKAQKMAGVILANIGAETVSMVVFENDSPISLKVLPTGSADITNDLALQLQISMNEAERMKRGAITKTDVAKKKIDDVIAGRLKDIFGLINAHLKDIHRQRLLPAGIVITGGGSGLTTARDVAKATLKLPSQIGAVEVSPQAKSADATWAVAFGLCKWGFATEHRESGRGVADMMPHVFQHILKALRALLP